MNMIEIAKKLGIEELGVKAAERVETNSPYLFCVSGKMAAGKDTTAFEVIQRLGVKANKIAVGDLIREELNEILTLLKNEGTSQSIVEEFGLQQEAADRLVKIFTDRYILKIADVYVRTDEIRKALQLLGNSRRAEDVNYWIGPWQKKAISLISEGKHVYSTDFRVPDEADAGKAVGFELLRLDISRSVQIDRLIKRDGFAPSKETLEDRSEKALDTYNKFDLRINNENESQVSVNTIVSYLQNLRLVRLK